MFEFYTGQRYGHGWTRVIVLGLLKHRWLDWF